MEEALNLSSERLLDDGDVETWLSWCMSVNPKSIDICEKNLK